MKHRYVLDLSKYVFAESFEIYLYSIFKGFEIPHKRVGSKVFYNKKITQYQFGQLRGYSMALSEFMDEDEASWQSWEEYEN